MPEKLKLRFASTDNPNMRPNVAPRGDEEDILVIYMNEIGKLPVLDKEREFDLFILMDAARREAKKLIRKAIKISGRKEIRNFWDIKLAARSAEKEEDKTMLLNIADQVEELEEEINRCREEIIKGNLRLPVFIAKRYKDSGLPLMDLIQEGNSGLMTAVDRYDYQRGTKFSSYASIWIQQAIGYAIANHSRTIRLPVYMHDTLRRVSKVIEEFVKENSREPEMSELVELTGMPKEKLERIRRLAQCTSSLDENISGQDDTSIMDFIPDDRMNPENETVDRFLQQEIETMINSLSDREQQILRLRYGFNDGKSHSLQEIGERMELSRERIRQIENRALDKLRHPSRSSRLREYLA